MSEIIVLEVSFQQPARLGGDAAAAWVRRVLESRIKETFPDAVESLTVNWSRNIRKKSEKI